MNRFKIFSAAFAVLAVTLACGIQLSNPEPDVNAIVSQTMAALTAGAHAPVATGTVAPAEPATLLPRSLYFVNGDAAGLAQVFRLERDGKTLTQLTFEPAAVTSFDINQTNGQIVYTSNNQLLIANADGSGRQMIFDGGIPDVNNPYINSVYSPAWSPNGQTIAYGYGGLNLYSVATGVSNLAIPNQLTDAGGGFLFPSELYWPGTFSPDGTKLLVSLGYYEGGSSAIYYMASNSLVRLSGAEGGALICCGEPDWTADSAALYSANPSLGMFNSGLWKVDAATGQVTTLLAAEAGDNLFNFADEAFLAPSGQLYYFFATAPLDPATGMMINPPLQMVRSAPDGVTGRVVVNIEIFNLMNEALWSPDASFALVASAPIDQVYQGGIIEVIYTDGRASVQLLDFASSLRWGP